MTSREDTLDKLSRRLGRAAAKGFFAFIGALAIAISTIHYGFGLYDKKIYSDTLNNLLGDLTTTQFQYELIQTTCLNHLNAKKKGKIPIEVSKKFFLLYRARVNEMLDTLEITSGNVPKIMSTLGPQTASEVENFIRVLTQYYFVDEMRCDDNLPHLETLKQYELSIKHAVTEKE